MRAKKEQANPGQERVHKPLVRYIANTAFGAAVISGIGCAIATGFGRTSLETYGGAGMVAGLVLSAMALLYEGVTDPEQAGYRFMELLPKQVSELEVAPTEEPAQLAESSFTVLSVMQSALEISLAEELA